MSDRRRGEGNEKAVPPRGAAVDFALPDFVKMATSVVNTWSELNSDLIALAQSSLENNMAVAEEMRRIQSPTELVDVQLRFVRRAYADYVDEAGKIGQMVQKLSTEAMQALTPHA